MAKWVKAIQQRRKSEKLRRDKQRAESRDVGNSVDFKVGLAASLRDIKCLLGQNEVTSVTIEVPEDQLHLFNEAIYTHALQGYELRQDTERANVFTISYQVLFEEG